MNFKSIWSEKVGKIICFSVFSVARFKWAFTLVRFNNDELAKFRVLNTQSDGEVKRKSCGKYHSGILCLFFLMFHNLSHIVVLACVVCMFCIYRSLRRSHYAKFTSLFFIPCILTHYPNWNLLLNTKWIEVPFEYSDFSQPIL